METINKKEDRKLELEEVTREKLNSSWLIVAPVLPIIFWLLFK